MNAPAIERWAVTQVGGHSGEEMTDVGIDGVIRFPAGTDGPEGRALVTVKLGAEPHPRTVRDLAGADAEMAILVVRGAPTPPLTDAARHAGIYRSPGDGQTYPRVKVLGLDQLLSGERPALPTA